MRWARNWWGAVEEGLGFLLRCLVLGSWLRKREEERDGDLGLFLVMNREKEREILIVVAHSESFAMHMMVA